MDSKKGINLVQVPISSPNNESTFYDKSCIIEAHKFPISLICMNQKCIIQGRAICQGCMSTDKVHAGHENQVTALKDFIQALQSNQINIEYKKQREVQLVHFNELISAFVNIMGQVHDILDNLQKDKQKLLEKIKFERRVFRENETAGFMEWIKKQYNKLRLKRQNSSLFEDRQQTNQKCTMDVLKKESINLKKQLEQISKIYEKKNSLRSDKQEVQCLKTLQTDFPEVYSQFDLQRSDFVSQSFVNTKKHNVPTSLLNSLLIEAKCQKIQKLKFTKSAINDQTLSILQDKIHLQANLSVLELGGCTLLTEKALELYFYVSSFERLEELQLWSLNITDNVLLNLSRTTFFMRTLCLNCCQQLTSNGMEGFFRNGLFDNLQNLNLRQTAVGDNSLDILSIKLDPKQLKFINMSECSKLTDQGIQNFFSTLSPSHIEGLLFYDTQINGQTLEHVPSASLKELHLMGCKQIKSNEFMVYLALNQFKNLQEISLADCQFDQSCLQVLSQKISQDIVTVVNLSGCKKITAAGFVQFFTVCQFTKLKELRVNGCQLDDDALMLLIDLLPNLTYFALHSSYQVTSQGLFRMFSQCQSLGNLEVLQIYKTDINGEVITEVAQKVQKNVFKEINVGQFERSEQILPFLFQDFPQLDINIFQ